MFSDEPLERLKVSFSNLGRQTNLVRDLDVYLLSKNEYLDMLPDTLRQGGENMFADFEKQRVGAQKKLKAF